MFDDNSVPVGVRDQVDYIELDLPSESEEEELAEDDDLEK